MVSRTNQINNGFKLLALILALLYFSGTSQYSASNDVYGSYHLSAPNVCDILQRDYEPIHFNPRIINDQIESVYDNFSVLPPTTSVTLNPSKDTWMNADSGSDDMNYGLSTELRIDRESTKLERALLQFDLPNLPPCAVITSATLKLTKIAGNDDINIDVHQVTSDWDEGTGGVPGSAGDASWNERQPGISWTTAGGDYGGSVSSVNVLGNGDYYWDVTSIVQDWVSGTNNFGFILESPDGGGNRTNSFASNENAIAADRPVLTINYESFGNPLLWLMADAGFSAPTWSDQGTHGNDGTIFGDPTSIANSMNFNPGINFDGNDHVEVNLPELVFENGNNSVAVFVVYKPSTTSTSIGIFGNQSTSGIANINISDGNYGQGSSLSAIPLAFGTNHHLVSYIIDEENNIGGGSNDSKIYHNGSLITSFTFDENSAAAVDNMFHIGKSGSNASSQFFQGDIFEILIYHQDNGSLVITEAQRIQIESYLAIKYGVSLTHDYTDSQ